ncbi:MBL fold metallo-hydrolase [Occultella glacieicola]|uniref:MBL fold metallo-hydrolase n=1 Tax=Occultella glacieicola TaxID=2518684 RepID=A0ABY2E110_9MICO|nr:MBL fold metallo-hydrolase [Occultella glacieicola]TDE91613.1 MBL fold metallo-hydrolase [Occultella glacieicola]
MTAHNTRITDRVELLRCDNPGPMTLEGTNTYLLREPGSAEVLVVDPGPLDPADPEHLAHLDRVRARAEADGGRVAAIWLTHHHLDHAGAAERLAHLTGAPVRGAGRGTAFMDGESVRFGDLEVVVHLAPGHTADSVLVRVPVETLLLSGDTLLGRGTTVIMWPDGDLGAYLATLAAIAADIDAGRVTRIAPGHGAMIEDPAVFVAGVHQHRLDRLDQVRTAVGQGADGVRAVVRAVYGDQGPKLAAACARIVQAQFAHLGLDPETD